MTMTMIDAQTLMQVFAERLLNATAAGVVLAAVVAGLLRLVGRHSAAMRFAAWFSVLAGLALVPFVSGVSPAHFFRGTHVTRGIVLSAGWAPGLLALWAMGAGWSLLRLGVGLWRVHEVRKNCVEIDAAQLDSALAEIFTTLPSRRVALCTSSELAVPAAVGLFRPAIVFPAELWPRLSDNEKEMIVRHELAHLRRWDDWTNLAQKTVKAVFFFHPAVWWIENRLTLEREMACDEIVLEQTGSARAYASSLIAFAEKLESARALALAQALVSRMHQMSARVAQILSAKPAARKAILWPVLSLNAALLALVIGVGPRLPKLVAFENHAMTALPPTAEIAQQITKPGNAPRGIAGQPSLPAQAKAIPAMFHPAGDRSSYAPVNRAPRQVKAKTAAVPLILRTSVQELPAPQGAIFIFRVTNYEIPSLDHPPVWTFCIWRLNGGDAARSQMESAIVVSWI